MVVGPHDLTGTVAVVTGASSGLGRATVDKLNTHGVTVVGADLTPPDTDSAALHVPCDVTDEDSVRSVFTKVEELDGPLMSVVNCAGVRLSLPVLGEDGPHPLGAFRRLIEINLVGTFNVVRLAAASMARNPEDPGGARGAIVNTASVAGYEGLPGQAAYAASKAAVVGMTITLARDLAPHGIRVNTIAPGVIDSPLLDGLTPERRGRLAEDVVFPPRLGSPDEFAELAFFLLQSRYMNGETVRLDGALRMNRG